MAFDGLYCNESLTPGDGSDDEDMEAYAQLAGVYAAADTDPISEIDGCLNFIEVLLSEQNQDEKLYIATMIELARIFSANNLINVMVALLHQHANWQTLSSVLNQMYQPNLQNMMFDFSNSQHLKVGRMLSLINTHIQSLFDAQHGSANQESKDHESLPNSQMEFYKVLGRLFAKNKTPRLQWLYDMYTISQRSDSATLGVGADTYVPGPAPPAHSRGHTRATRTAAFLKAITDSDPALLD